MKKNTANKISSYVADICIYGFLVGIIGAIWSKNVMWHNIWLTSLVVFIASLIVFMATEEEK